jgi:hypothetical protein
MSVTFQKNQSFIPQRSEKENAMGQTPPMREASTLPNIVDIR